MELFLKADTWLALLTLCFLEIVLGIDNIIFISIVSNKLPEEQRTKARNLGLFLAMFVRIALLLTITWIIQFTQPLFTVPANFVFGEAKSFSGKDLILGFGGLFLIAKSTMEINHGMESDEEHGHGQKKKKVVDAIRYRKNARKIIRFVHYENSPCFKSLYWLIKPATARPVPSSV